MKNHKEDDHKDEKKEHGAEDRYSSAPQKAHPTGEFEFGNHALRHLASRLAHACDQTGRDGGRQTKNLILAFFKIHT